MEQVYLISADFVRGLTNISNNIQDKFLSSAIRETQDIELVEVIGTKLFNKLCSLVSDGSIADEENEKYKLLLDASQYFMAYSCVSKLVMITTVKIDNMGANTTSDDNVNQLSINDSFRIEDYYKNKADFYKRRLQSFLAKNYSQYKELSATDCYDIAPNLYSATSSQIFVGGARGKGRGKCHLHYDK